MTEPYVVTTLCQRYGRRHGKPTCTAGKEATDGCYCGIVYGHPCEGYWNYHGQRIGDIAERLNSAGINFTPPKPLNIATLRIGRHE